MKYQEGKLYQVVDAFSGELLPSIVLFLRMVVPMKEFPVDHQFFQDFKIGSNLWHMEVLMDGRVDWLPTDHFTLMGPI